MKVYVAGPYTKGDVVVNVRNAIAAADALLALGHHPFVPHLTHLWYMVSPKGYREWLDYDLVWLRQCDALLRIPGESAGADEEVSVASKLAIPVCYSIEDVKRVHEVFLRMEWSGIMS